MIDIESLVGQLAFPIVVSLWFMFRTDKLIQTNTEATERLSLLIEKLYFKEEKKIN